MYSCNTRTETLIFIVFNIDIKKLRGYKNHYRLRIGSYRVLFEFESGDTILIHAILHRKKAYTHK
ncbi:MAG: type II toxin-antitoxin system RelE family toxin [Candidatus Asgardarchaeia archaeon]